LSVDDVQVAATTEYLGGTFNLSFGDGAISNPTISEWDYVTIQPNAVPEPGTYSLLVLGLGCLIAMSKSLHLVNIHKGRPHASMSPTAGIFARACRGGSTLPP
jgi:hypothetical protein